MSKSDSPMYANKVLCITTDSVSYMCTVCQELG